VDGIVTRLWAEKSGIRFQAGKGNISTKFQRGSGAHPASSSMGVEGIFLEVKWQGRDAAYLNLASRLRMSLGIHPLSIGLHGV
jgi:hypothetical protein